MDSPAPLPLPSPTTRHGGGWPWDAASAPMPPALAAQLDRLPTITLVSPNYNYERWLERCLRSVLLQGYPKLQYIVIDDGSTDGSVPLLRRYERFLSHWETGPNRGHRAALSRGLDLATGTYVNWICSDDYLLPGALWDVAALCLAERAAPHFIVGATESWSDGKLQHTALPSVATSVASALDGALVLPQPSTFLFAESLKAAWPATARLDVVVDTCLYLNLLREVEAGSGSDARVVQTSKVLARAEVHGAAQTVKKAALARREMITVYEDLLRRTSGTARRRIRFQLRRLRDHDALYNAEGQSLGPFLKTALRRPGVLGMRFFWGGLRKRLRRQPMK